MRSVAEQEARSSSEGNLEASIRTWREIAGQSESSEALEARSAIEEGSTIFRRGNFSENETTEGQYWATENPLTTPDYAQRYGLPSNNEDFDFVIGGTLKPGSDFVTREAPGFGDNVVTGEGEVAIDWWYMP